MLAFLRQAESSSQRTPSSTPMKFFLSNLVVRRVSAFKSLWPFKGLICGLNRLWPAFHVEMGSSNLNFSSETVMLMLGSLSARTGHPQDNQHVHSQTSFFQDAGFCKALLSQTDKRISSVRSNWHEHCSIHILITLILKLLELGSASVRTQALYIPGSARDTTVKRTRLLRKEYWCTTNVVTSRRLSQLILWATLLCKQ